MKKKYLILIGAVALLGTVAVGGSLAANSATSGKAVENISEKSLDIAIVDAQGNEYEDGDVALQVTPGGDTPLNYRISNQDANGYDVYVKVNVYYSWQDDENDELFLEQDANNYVTLKLDGTQLQPVDSYENPIAIGDWRITYCDSQEVEMYYTKPLVHGDEPIVFLDSISFDSAMGNKFAGKELSIEPEVKAVQVNNGESAIVTEWGLYPTIAEDGTILSVSETKN